MAGTLMSTNCVPSSGSRGLSPGATSSRRSEWETSEHTSGQVLNDSGPTRRASVHSVS